MLASGKQLSKKCNVKVKCNPPMIEKSNRQLNLTFHIKNQHKSTGIK